MADDTKDYGEGIDPDLLRQQVDQLTPDAQQLVANRLAEIAKAKEPPAPPNYGSLNDAEWRKIINNIR